MNVDRISPVDRILPEDHQFMTNMEIAQCAGVSVKTVQNWKKAKNIPNNVTTWGGNCSSRPFSYINRGIAYPKVTDRKIWDNKFWLNYMYNEVRLGTSIISSIVGRSNFYVKRRFRRYGIKLRSIKEGSVTLNPYCVKEWLEEHYVLERKTLSECARLANVNNYTIYNWLVKYGFEIRDKYEANAVPRSS